MKLRPRASPYQLVITREALNSLDNLSLEHIVDNLKSNILDDDI